ncbi:YdeI/OmpD-associated family protein [Actinophytocola oryzae]|uniref:Uncharacterized protein DUF1905 n=1 Tax=Actinophytocola oryzae TaxID=502181 RepID=A0A4R7V5C9_9PSEU|nr:YdeI/OmpD-associated family protein [Actinophytocola oryzae]TDV43155.1 uncharacterized protein DUF1905 [Actinophytocola oryzae]
MRFRAKVELGGKSATGIEVPAEVVAALESGNRPKVTVTIGGHTYRSTVATRDGRFMLPLSAQNRERAKVSAGDEVEVTVEPDNAVREVDVPADLGAALDADPAARAFFDRLSYSAKRWHVLNVEGARTPGTRARRIEKSVAMLRASRAR